LTAYLTDAAHYGVTLLLATGSKAHLGALRRIAAERNLTLDERGLCSGNRVIAAATEEQIYKALGMQPIPPELREGRDETEEALAGTLPELVTDADIKGILHAHTNRSDGTDTLETMVEATLARGYQYFGVADHSQSAHYAGGLNTDEVAKQQAEADRLNQKYGRAFRIFKGIESDILADGSLDFPDEVLDKFDFVVASVHGRFKLDRETQTERILGAVVNPYTTILGHMTGRQLLRRPGYEIDIERVLAACAEQGVAVEINANPWRLDLDWRWHGTALRLGCMMSINPDAHSTREIDLTHWGVEMARKGGVPKERILNCLSGGELASYLAKRRDRRPTNTALPQRKSVRPGRSNAESEKRADPPKSRKRSLADPFGPARLPFSEPNTTCPVSLHSIKERRAMASEKNLQELFHETLKDIYFAEKKILSALPKMQKAAQSQDLKAAFEKHETETDEHVARLEKVFEEIDQTPRGKTCDAIMGIIAEGQEVMKDFKGAPALDAGLLAAAQAVEHYEIARYGTLKTWAAELGLNQAVKLLERTLAEEKKTDETLTKLAESEVNQHAQAA
jgi:ferritin-like metal-binding protein YciE/histidinol phosphatase-like PHP family hydrolase